MSSSKPRIFGLDLMRAVAITMVVVGHLAWLFPSFPQTLKMLFSLSAFFGVEIFFVLSGFLIGGILLREFEKDDFTFAAVSRFVRRRWFRTLPAYFLVLLFNIIVAISLEQTMHGPWRYFFFLQNFAWPMPLFFSESWSLSVEEFAYVLLPMALFLGARFGKSKSGIFVNVTMVLIELGLMAKLIYHFASPSVSMEEWNLSLKAVVIYRMDSIFVGVLFAWTSIRFADAWRKFRWLLAFVGLLGVGFFTVGVGGLGLFIERIPIFWDVIYLPMVSVCFACFLPLLSLWKSPGLSILKPISFLAMISYSAYLLHYSLLLQFFNRLLPFNAGFKLRAVTALVYFFSVIVCSYLLYRFYEKPLMDLRDKTRRNP